MSATNLLDDSALEFYSENGYWLHRRPVFNREKFDQLRKIFEEHLANRGDLRPDELDTPHLRDARLLEFLRAGEVLDLVEQLIGPNIVLWTSHFISKEPQQGRATPWHEDSTYWKEWLDPMDKIVTIWLAIDPTDRENGCMKVIPGSHLWGGFSEYESVEDVARNTFDTQIKAGQFDEGKAVYFELEPNQCSLHDGRMIHGADANTSTRRRTAYTMRYMASSTKFFAEKLPQHKLWHCRGENLADLPLEY